MRSLRGRWERPILEALEEARREQTRTYSQLEALIGLLIVLQPRLPLPPFRGWAISPDFAGLLATHILVERPDCVVELGSGVSTLVFGYALERTGGQLVSVEHDLTYAKRSQAAVLQHGLADRVRVIHAPLVPWSGAGRWYEQEFLKGLPPIDLLVVDGPPAATGPQARYPALPILASALAPDAVIMADDTFRADERAMVDRWLHEYPGLTATPLIAEKGAVQLRRQPRPNLGR
jgi:predicted O-methyltransferase YrrM